MSRQISDTTADALKVQFPKLKQRKCGNCRQIGHNVRTCKNPRTAKPVPWYILALQGRTDDDEDDRFLVVRNDQDIQKQIDDAYPR